MFYQLGVVAVYTLMYLGLLEIWPAILHFHHADITLSAFWEVPIRAGVMPFLMAMLLSSVCDRQRRILVALAAAPAITFLLNGALQEARFEFWEISLWLLAAVLSIAGAWTHAKIADSALSGAERSGA